MINLHNIVQEIQPMLRPSSRLWVAYSGGLDSTVLLHMMAHANLQVPVIALHVNHQLSPNAQAWQDHCERVCLDFNVECHCEKVEVFSRGKGLEQDAREQRYQVFAQKIQKDDLLVLAHHRDDQAETLLFRLLRGAGLRGLAGIRRQRVLAKGHILRPLLNISQSEIHAYAQQHGLSWVDDESNEDRRFDRNYLRHEVLPRMRERWPTLEQRFAETSQWLAEADSLLEEYAQEDLASCLSRTERLGESIALEPYLSLSQQRQKHLIRSWCGGMGFSLPDSAQLSKVDQVVHARVDAKPVLAWGRCELRRYKSRLYLVPKLPSSDVETITWQTDQALRLADGSLLTCHVQDGKSSKELKVRFRQGGERCRPNDRSKSQSLKKLFQEYELEPWLRERQPLVYEEERLIAVPGLFACDAELYKGYEWQWEYGASSNNGANS